MLTAHPTEAARRTVLAAHLRVSALLERLDDPLLAPPQRAEIDDELAAEITMLWQADEVRSRRPHVVDEIRNGHWFFEQSLSTRPSGCSPSTGCGFPARRRRSASVGGSAATPTAIPAPARTRSVQALRARAQLMLARYRDEVRTLAAEIGVSSRLTPVDQELLDSIARDERELPGYADAIGDQNLDEPYRRKLSFVWRRLGDDAYPSVARFAEDLDVSTAACARIAVHASPTARSPRSAAASSCSASTSRSSIYGYMRARR